MCAFITAKQQIYHPNCILFTHKFQTPVYHSDSHYNLIRFFRASCLHMLFYAKWLLTSYQYNICVFKWIRCTFIILHCWWCFFHDLDMVEIGKWQLRDNRLNVQSPFALLRISTSIFGISVLQFRKEFLWNTITCDSTWWVVYPFDILLKLWSYVLIGL